MVEISSIFSLHAPIVTQNISLCGHLEAFVGGYFLSQAGIPGACWYGIYYDASINPYMECPDLIDRNLKGYSYCDGRVAFVLNQFLDKFKNDTRDYCICYIGVTSLDDEVLKCTACDSCKENIQPVLWIDDDFLNDENIPFDFTAFGKIDDGAQYINPNHFSVKHFVSCAVLH